MKKCLLCGLYNSVAESKSCLVDLMRVLPQRADEFTGTADSKHIWSSTG